MTFVKNCKIALDILCGRLKDIFNHELFNPNSGVEKSGFGYFMVEKSGVEKSGVEISSPYQLKGHFNHGLFNPRLGVEKSRVEKFMVEKSGVGKSRVGKFTVDKSGVEAWG